MCKNKNITIFIKIRTQKYLIINYAIINKKKFRYCKG